MFTFRQDALAFLRREDGPTAVEYAVVLALIVIVCIAAIQSIGNNVDETAEVVSGALTGAS
jgi:pilus assembly protein Flp/PilA